MLCSNAHASGLIQSSQSIHLLLPDANPFFVYLYGIFGTLSYAPCKIGCATFAHLPTFPAPNKIADKIAKLQNKIPDIDKILIAIIINIPLIVAVRPHLSNFRRWSKSSCVASPIVSFIASISFCN